MSQRKKLKNAIYKVVWPTWMSYRDFQKTTLYCFKYIPLEAWTSDCPPEPRWLEDIDTDEIGEINRDRDWIEFNNYRLNKYLSYINKYYLNITQRQLDNIPIRIAEIFLFARNNVRFYNKMSKLINEYGRPVENTH